MKVSLEYRNRREAPVFAELDPLTETRTEPVWIQTLADIVGLLTLGAVGLLAMIVL